MRVSSHQKLPNHTRCPVTQGCPVTRKEEFLGKKNNFFFFFEFTLPRYHSANSCEQPSSDMLDQL